MTVFHGAESFGAGRVALAAGDCIYFWSYLPHCIRSIDDEPARTIHAWYRFVLRRLPRLAFGLLPFPG